MYTVGEITFFLGRDECEKNLTLFWDLWRHCLWILEDGLPASQLTAYPWNVAKSVSANRIAIIYRIRAGAMQKIWHLTEETEADMPLKGSYHKKISSAQTSYFVW